VLDFTKKVKKNSRVVILGAGKDGKTACDYLLDHGVVVECFMDANPGKWGREYSGIEVRQPRIIDKDKMVLICIGEFCYLSDDDILSRDFIKQLNINQRHLFVLDRSISILSVWNRCLSKNHIDNTHEILNLNGIKFLNYLKFNDAVQRTFLTECCDLILPKFFKDFSVVDEGPYETELFHLSPLGGDTVFDCGANIGIFSTIAASFSNNQVFAFEPIRDSCKFLEKLIDIYPNISVYHMALSDFNGKVKMSNSSNLGQNKIIDNETKYDFVEVDCKTIDSFVEEYNIKKVDFIKADIEGAERYMLRGAVNVLREFAPKLSICTYHLDDDPIVLEKIIKAANPEYIIEHHYKKLYAYVK
jgi:FkbM family methyltransferase